MWRVDETVVGAAEPPDRHQQHLPRLRAAGTEPACPLPSRGSRAVRRSTPTPNGSRHVSSLHDRFGSFPPPQRTVRLLRLHHRTRTCALAIAKKRTQSTKLTKRKLTGRLQSTRLRW